MKFIRVEEGSSVSTVAIVDPDSEEKSEDALTEEIIPNAEAAVIEEAALEEKEADASEVSQETNE